MDSPPLRSPSPRRLLLAAERDPSGLGGLHSQACGRGRQAKPRVKPPQNLGTQTARRREILDGRRVLGRLGAL